MRRGNKRMREVYDYIVGYTRENGYPPTYREIGDGVGLRSLQSVSLYIIRLEELGVISTRNGQPRTIRVLTDFEEKEGS